MNGRFQFTVNPVFMCGILVALSLTSTMASADMQCAPVTGADKETAIAEMRRKASDLPMKLDTFDGCKNSRASVLLEPTPLPDGSRLNSFILCWREPDGWDCTIHTPRGMEANVKVGGKKVTVSLGLNEWYTVEVGQQYLQRAIDLAPTLTERDVCSYSAEKLPEIRKALATLKADFRFNGPKREARLWEAGNGPGGVTIGDQAIDLVPDENGKGLKLRCWSMSWSPS